MQFDFSRLDPRDGYKLIVSTVVPRPIAWVVTQGPEGQLNAGPFSFFNAFSGDPPVVGIGIGKRGAAMKDTARNILASGEFAVNLVSEEMIHEMNITGIEFGPEVDEIAEAKLATLPSVRIKPPRIADSPVALECERLTTVDIGDSRVIVIGRVLLMHVRDDCVLDPQRCYIDTPKLRLVGRMHGRGWYARTTDRFELPRIEVKDWEARTKAAAEG
ncbi:MAG TPA: flavin reductase family protein [Stellaceae bacterium]|nr:flavin reductase family protein [Stellaceae bacterium]